MKRFYILASALLLAISAVPVSAAPGFPACSSPEGTLKVSYESGWHGIIGTGANHEGSDSVYTINGSQLLQCFCPAGDNDAGTQTDWWKISGLSESEINAYRLQGWVFVPSGLDWGLDDASFLAKNSSFDCKENPPGPSATPTPTPSPTVTPGPKNDDFSESGPWVCPRPAPPAPVLLNVARNGTTATLVWSEVPQATHYTISYGLKPGEYIYGVPNTGKVTAYTIGNLDPVAAYYFSIRAVDDCAPSGPSSEPAIGGSVLGLATTGNSQTIFGLILMGLSLLGLSFWSRRVSK